MVAVGLDLGVSYACVAYFKTGKIHICKDEAGNQTVPSYVSFNDRGKIVGDAARIQTGWNSVNTVYDVKRMIGKYFDEPGLQHELKLWSFQVVNINGKPRVKVDYLSERREFTPEEILSSILAKAKEVAEKEEGSPVTDAVLTVPAHFKDSQRQASKEAATSAGFNVLRVINEPTAAAISYALDLKCRESKVLVFDLGGGSLDITILTVEDGVYEVRAITGDQHLGGNDFDARLVNFMIEQFKQQHDRNVTKDIVSNRIALRRLRTACERAKRELSSADEAYIEIDALFEGIDFNVRITREQFEQLNNDLFERTLVFIDKALNEAKLPRSAIHNVVMVGGSSHIPKIIELVKTYFYDKDPLNTISPDHVVAHGAAIQAGILTGMINDRVRELLLLGNTPLSLGIENSGGVMSVIIPRDTKIPCRRTRTFTTRGDYQPAVTIEVYEGERPMTSFNNLLGSFELKDIPHAYRGVPEIDVTFDIDVDNILYVSAKCRGGGGSDDVADVVESKLKIVCHKGRLTSEEVLNLISEAERHKAEDQAQCGRIAAKNFLEGLAYRLKNAMEDESVASQLDDNDRTSLFKKAQEVIGWLAKNPNVETEEFVTKRKDIEKIFHPIMRCLFPLDAEE